MFAVTDFSCTCLFSLLNKAGEFSNGTACVSCFTGHYCPSMTVHPLPCVNGTYSDKRGSVACDMCPAGYSCLNVSDPPRKCNSGEYSIAGDAVCKVYSIWN
jgi:hypothetical protein